ncbi:MAG: hypothetical protein AAGF11_16550 [Myxococcota bacterium]
MTMLRTTLISGLIGLCFALSACDKGDAKSKDTKTAAAGKSAADKSAAGKSAADKSAAGKDAAGKDAAGKAKPGDESKKAPEPEEDKFDDRVVKAAELADKIEADPAKADEILTAAGMDRASFDSLLHEVSTPELAEQYRLARARSGS